MEYATKMSYRQIAMRLGDDIVNGAYPPGSLLPPEPELAERFGVSRSLMNRALTVLASEGKVRAKQGSGTRVTWLPPILHSSARYRQDLREADGARGAFDAEIRALGLDPIHEITTQRAAAPDHIAELLGLEPGQINCLARRRRLLASHIPMRLNCTWIPLDIAEGTVLEDSDAVLVGGVKSALAELGVRQTEAIERWFVRRPTEPEAISLEISPDRSVLDLLHIGQTADGRAVEVTTTVTPADTQIIEYRFPLS
jgi:GntR family transcriptional regulator